MLSGPFPTVPSNSAGGKRAQQALGAMHDRALEHLQRHQREDADQSAVSRER
jgi:hypothetical protein